MAALTAGRKTQEARGLVYQHPVAAGEVIYAGAMVSLDASGNAVAATATAAENPFGRAEAEADNTGGSAGDITVDVRRGVFGWDDDGVAGCIVGAPAYVVDDHTVSSDDATAARPLAGKVLTIDSDTGLVFVDHT